MKQNDDVRLGTPDAIFPIDKNQLIDVDKEIEVLGNVWSELKKQDEFQSKISSEESAIRYCMDLGLLVNENVCEECNVCMPAFADTSCRLKFRFRCPKCEKRQSALKGTWFSNKRLRGVRFSKLLQIIRGFTEHRSIREMAAVADLNYQTVHKQYCLLRGICLLAYENQNKIGGEGKTVDVDESVYGWPKSQGCRTISCRLLGAVERESGRFFVEPIESHAENRMKDEIWCTLLSRIAPATTIVTTSSQKYRGLDRVNGYRHRDLSDPVEEQIYRKNVEKLRQDLKTVLGRNLSIRQPSIPYFLAEAWVRITCKDFDMFDYIVDLISTLYNGNENTLKNFKDFLKGRIRKRQSLAKNMIVHSQLSV